MEETVKLFNTRKFVPMYVLYTLLAAGSLIIRLININTPILESFGFRQTQTAITVQTWIHEGVSIFNYSTPVFGFPYKVPFEFPVYQLSAYFLNSSFVSNLDLALRLTNMIYFYASTVLLYFICKQLLSDRMTIFSIIAVYLLNPFSIFWSRTSMIDFCSVTFGLAYLLITLIWVKTQNRTSLLICSIVTGSLAYLTKVTSMFPIVAILGFYLILNELNFLGKFDSTTFLKKIGKRLKSNWLYYIKLVIILIVPVVIGYAWVKFTDMVKIEVGQSWLTSSSLKMWNYGTIEQKVSTANWGVIANRIFIHMFPYVCSLFLVSIIFTAKFLKPDEKKLAALSMFAAVITIFILFNLYYVHDYYLMAIVPYLSIIVGINIHYIFRILLRNKQFILIVFLVITSAVSYTNTPDYFNITKDKDALTYENNATVQLGRYLEDLTDYDENIIITDADWSSEILYYSNRKGLMLREDMQIDEGEIRDNNFKLIAAKNPKLYPLLFTSFEDVAFIKEVSGFNIYAIDPGRGIDLADIENEQENTADRAIEYDVSEKAQAYIDRIVQNPIPGIAVEIDGWGFIEGSKADYQSIILEFKNTQKSYFFKATKVERKDVGEHFQDDEYNYSGFNCLIRDAEELTGEYKVNIIINDGEKYYTSNQQFDVIIN